MSDDAIDEEKLRRFVEATTGGTVVRMERQSRWRRAWFVDVRVAGEIRPVYIRGERGGDVMPFTDMRREAQIIEELEAQGILVPHIYGYCADPVAIVMEAVRGTRDVAEAGSDAERHDIARQYMAQVARMHAAPVDGFVRRGLDQPKTAEEIAFAGLNAYLPLYRRVKCKPEPLIEFAWKWLRLNPPLHRTEGRFIQFDCGQFLFENGRVTSLYDMEFAMIGDPMADLASMRMRESVEPYGDTFATLIRRYEEFSGTPIDEPALLFHNIVFSAVSLMQFSGALAQPTPGDPHDIYLLFVLGLRRTLVLAMAEALGVAIAEPEPPAASGYVPPLVAMLRDAVAQMPAADEAARMKRATVANLVEYLDTTAIYGADADAATLREVGEILGYQPTDLPSVDAALEAFVLDAPPEQDAALLRFFYRETQRTIAAYAATAIGQAAANVYLSPLR